MNGQGTVYCADIKKKNLRVRVTTRSQTLNVIQFFQQFTKC